PFISQSTRVSASPDESQGLPDRRHGRAWNGPPERLPAHRDGSTKLAARATEGNRSAKSGAQTRLPSPAPVLTRGLEGLAGWQGVSVRQIRPGAGLPSH